MKFAFILDPIARLDPGHDTTVALMEAAQAQGHTVWITDLSQLSIVNSRAWAYVQLVELDPVTLVDQQWQIPEPWYRLGETQFCALEDLDAVFMRTDPPVTTAYLYGTYILDYIDPTKTRVINNPQGIRAANEKMYALQFQSVIPTTIVSASKAQILDFVQQQGRAVLKPLGGKAGEGILFLEAGDRNLNSLLEISTH
ncbi:MAG: glutathione synthase, partial [Cyanobacteria bacterium P01_H01_bin.121]